MNKVLTLRGNKFQQRKNVNGGGQLKLPTDSVVKIDHLKKLHENLISTYDFWKENDYIDGSLVTFYYNRIVAKSNRVGGYISKHGDVYPNDTIVGAKYSNDKSKHIITHFIELELLENIVRESENVISLFEASFDNGFIDNAIFDDKDIFDNLKYKKHGINKTKFRNFLRDSAYVEKIGVEEFDTNLTDTSLVSFYDIKSDLVQTLKKIGVDVTPSMILNNSTVRLDSNQIDLVYSRAPYFISMAVEDFSKFSENKYNGINIDGIANIPLPSNEPIIGVIDTLFHDSVYFSNWVESIDLVSPHIKRNTKDYAHGTAVSSLIVDAPTLNPRLDDGCGRFRVRHFGVALSDGLHSFEVIKSIREIVKTNSDIKVWNMSLGSTTEVNDNFISVQAEVLDEIQAEFDVIFVIAGTNGDLKNGFRKKVGSPADSLNSIVVNSVDFSGNIPNYSREGVVLSFFIKPDVAYYGGDDGDYINVCYPFSQGHTSGTSYAAPLIARKMAYLIEIIGLSREEAKALLIDSASGWKTNVSFNERALVGYGIVPIRIDDILSTNVDEIKFIISDVSEEWNSYNYKFPVPIFENKYPYYAKATMCYFPKTSRSQGVDYTNTELNIKFGRLKEKGIQDIKNDKQNDNDAPGYIRENDARNVYRKWDNVKHICEKIPTQKRAKIIINEDNKNWGMEVKTVERLHKYDGKGLKFGVVVTLKENKGVNRIDEFIYNCELNGWLVTSIDVRNRIDIYNKISQEIEFEE